MVVPVQDFGANVFCIVEEPQIVLDVEASDPTHGRIGARKCQDHVEEGVQVCFMAAVLFWHHKGEKATFSYRVYYMVEGFAIEFRFSGRFAEQGRQVLSLLDQVQFVVPQSRSRSRSDLAAPSQDW